MSGFSRPAAAKMSTTPSGVNGARDDLPNGVVELFLWTLVAGCTLELSTACTAWKNATSSRIR